MLKKKAFVVIAVLLSVLLTSQTVSPASADTVTITDVTNSCPIEITSNSVTIDQSSTSVSLVNGRCVVEFLTVGSYSISMPYGVVALNYLLVGGGGGGGSGGGGAGGVVEKTNHSVIPGATYSITVGAGGIGGSGGAGARPVNATAGGSSIFGTETALGGGSGGQGNQRAGEGGSGGGSQYDCTQISCGGTGTPGQGTNGAAATHPSYGAGGGGGGAGGAGGNTILTYIGGKGGDGVVSSITGTPTYYGGGGGGGINSNNNQYCGLTQPGNVHTCTGQTPITTGGGAGGLGGGGRGSSWGFTGGTQGQYANGTPGEPNTGGGGGGTDPEDAYAYAGGSGLVVLSYISTASFRQVTFESNDGSGSSSIQLVQSGVDTALKPNSFVYEGYVFQGWNTQANGSGVSYGNLANFNTTTPQTLFAQWRPGVNRTATFDSNGGTGTQEPQIAGLATNLNVNQFSKTGNKFDGWNTSADGSGYSYEDEALYSFSQDVTLFAQWSVVGTPHTVSFFGNGATSGTTSSQIASSTQPLNAMGFLRTGYNFVGWNTSNNATTAAYLDLQKYSFTADLSLYAIWVSQSSAFTITFNGNNATSGSMGNQAATSRTVLDNNQFERTGYHFLNWNTAADGTGTDYLSSYIYNFGQSVTLYAVWGQDFTVTYNGNLNSSGNAPESQFSNVGGAPLTLRDNSGSLARAGYALTGWNTAADGSGKPYALGQSKIRLTSGATLYAQWVGAAYVVLYSGNESSSGTAPASQTYVYGSPGITLGDNGGELSRSGYLFAGWNTNPDGTGTDFASGATGATFAQDTVLFAKWTALAVPSAPLSVTATAGNSAATVKWAAPLNTGGAAITSYVVTASTGQTCTSATLSCTFANLANNTPVTFTVRAVNSAGSGLPSEATWSVTPVDPNGEVGPTEGDGNLPPKGIAGTGKFVTTNDIALQLSWDKKTGKLIPRTIGLLIGHIEATIRFTRNGTAYSCSANFGTIKPMPHKTKAEKAKALAVKTFLGKQFCTVKTKLDPKTTAPKGGITKANFTKIKATSKTSSQLTKEKAALAALKGFTGEVSIQIIRYRAYPTTMLNRNDDDGKGKKLSIQVRDTKVSLR